MIAAFLINPHQKKIKLVENISAKNIRNIVYTFASVQGVLLNLFIIKQKS